MIPPSRTENGGLSTMEPSIKSFKSSRRLSSESCSFISVLSEFLIASFISGSLLKADSKEIKSLALAEP